MKKSIACGTALTAFALSAVEPALGAEADSRATCEGLAALATDGFRVDAAEWVEANAAAADGAPAAGPPQTRAPAVAHCLFRVTLDARPSSIEGVSLGIAFELRLPLAWNGRFLFQGGGGLNGALNPAFGNVAGAQSALERGFAVVSTDGGHRGRSIVDSSFAADQQAKLDFAYQAVQRTTYEAKSLVDRFYGRPPEYSYFMGCSTGGREGMLAAQRLPLEFDGVVAGDPAFNLTRIAANQVYSLQTVARIAPPGANGRPDTSAAFTDAQLQGVASAVTAQCDALDGLADGLINDFEACGFDPKSLQCGAATNAGEHCLSEPQVTALKDIFAGARNSNGESLYGAFTFDTGIASPAWRSMHLGSDGRPPANASLGSDTLRLFAMTPARPDLDPLEFDFDRDMSLTMETAAINDAVGTLHSSFAARGGKLILYHGLSDQGMSAGALKDWYVRLTPQDESGPQDWARLFFVPGMLHCAGGQATDSFDMLTAIQAWVEDDVAPDRVVASGRALPGVTRPLCPYPSVARYERGDPNDAASFSCR
jgi:feruloyl esterase